MIKIPVALTPGEIVECIHALKSMTRFNNTEQRDSNTSAIIALEYAYDQYVTIREEQAMNMRSMFRDAYKQKLENNG